MRNGRRRGTAPQGVSFVFAFKVEGEGIPGGERAPRTQRPGLFLRRGGGWGVAQRSAAGDIIFFQIEIRVQKKIEGPFKREGPPLVDPSSRPSRPSTPASPNMVSAVQAGRALSSLVSRGALVGARWPSPRGAVFQGGLDTHG